MLYDDVLQFWSQTEVAYTPTLGVTFGGLRGEDYWYQQSNVWEHPILSHYVPPHLLQPRSVRRVLAPDSDYYHTVSAKTAKALGFDGDIGSIEAGKLADLVILDANVLEDIFASDKVNMVMLNGRLYDAATLNEKVTGSRTTKPFYWQ